MSSSELVNRSSGDSTANGPHELLGTLAAVFEAAPYGVVVARGDWTIVFASAVAEATFAYAPGELIGQPVSRLLPAVAAAAHGEPRQVFSNTALSRRTGLDRIVEGVHKDGSTMPLEIGLNVLDVGPAPHIIVSIVDLTERRELDTRLAAAANEYVA